MKPSTMLRPLLLLTSTGCAAAIALSNSANSDALQILGGGKTCTKQSGLLPTAIGFSVQTCASFDICVSLCAGNALCSTASYVYATKQCSLFSLQVSLFASPKGDSVICLLPGQCSTSTVTSTWKSTVTATSTVTVPTTSTVTATTTQMATTTVSVPTTDTVTDMTTETATTTVTTTETTTTTSTTTVSSPQSTSDKDGCLSGQITKSNSKYFVQACTTDYGNESNLPTTTQPTYYDCIDHCATTNTCVGITYNVVDSRCHLKTSLEIEEGGKYNVQGDSAVLVAT